MSSRERFLAIVLILVVVFGAGGFFGYQFVFVPYSARVQNLKRLKEEEDAKRARLAEIEKQRAMLARWRALSLPADADVARLEYEKYLNNLMTRHKITNGREVIPLKADNKTSPTIGTKKEPIYTKLTFQVKGYATMANLVDMLHEFYETGLMHQIRSLKIRRPSTSSGPGGQQVRPDELDVVMKVEALIVSGADKRTYLLPNFDGNLMAADIAASVFNSGPLVLWASLSPGLFSPGLLADPARDYSAIARKNIFLGRPQKAPTGPTTDDGTPQWMAPRYVHLTDITHTLTRMEANIYDVSTNTKVKLKESSSGAYSFPFVRDGKGTRVLSGVVASIEDRDLIYRAEFPAGEESGLGATSNFFKPTKEEQENLVSERAVTAEQAKRALRVDQDYWDMLVRTLIVRTKSGDNFVVQLERDSDQPAAEGAESYSVEVLRGKVVYRFEKHVYILPDERYYKLHIGESVEDSLKKPLPAEKVKELKELAAK